MLRKQEAYLSMAEKTVGEMNKHRNTRNDNTIIDITLAKIEGIMTDIGVASARQNRKTSGFTKQKKEYRKMLNTQSDVILGIVRSYAVTVNNKNVYDNANLSLSDIRRIRDSEILIKVGTITKFVSNNMDELAPYGMTDKIMLSYNAAAVGYKEFLTKPQELMAERKTATKNLVKLFDDLEMEFNNNLDNHMMQYKLSEPQFYSDYINARTIYDESTISKSLMGTVTDQLTGKPLQYVKVIVKFKVGTDLADKVKTTSAKGNYQFKSLPPGVCKVVFKLPFYTSNAEDCVIHPNALTRLNSALQKK